MQDKPTEEIVEGERKRSLRHVSSAIFCIAFAASAASQVPSLAAQAPTCSASKAAGAVSRRAEFAIDSLTRLREFAGTVVVARGGVPLVLCASGWADAAWHVPNTPDTKFNIASLTKQFTGMAVLQLIGAGKLSLDDSIAKFYPAAPAGWRAVTIRRLLAHTAGIPGGELSDFYRGLTQPYTPQELVKIFAAKPLDFEPGTRWKYSNSGYYVLGYVIERVSGQPYAQYIQDHIFAPLGMTSSGYESNTRVIPNHAFGYVRDTIDRVTGLRYADYLDWSAPYAAGALYSTVGDLLLWDDALSGRGRTAALLPTRTLDSLFKPDPRPDSLQPRGAFYRAGWFVTRDANGRARVEHEGSDPGFGAFSLRFPEDGSVIVVLANIENAPVRQLATFLADALYSQH